MGGVPVGPAFVANVLPQQKRLQPALAPLEIIHRVLAPSAQVPQRLVLDLGDVDRRQIPAAHQARQRQRIAAIRFHPVPWLPRNQRRRHHVAGETLPREIAIQPVPTRPRLVDEHQPRALRLELADQLVDVALPRTDRAQRHHLRAPVVRRVGHGDGLLVDIETNIDRLARLGHG